MTQPTPHRRTAILLVGAFLIASFPAHFVPLRTGTDPSFWYGLNFLAGSDYRHGQDVVFPYGPLGFLLVPMDVHHNLLLGLAVWLLLHAALGALLVRRALRPGGVLPVATFAVLYLAAVALGLLFQYRVVVLIGLLMGESLEARQRSEAPAAAAGALAALGLLAKFGLGLAGVFMLFMGELLRAARQRPWNMRAPGATLAGFVAPLVVVGLPLFGSVSSVRLWLHDSLELASGYGGAMSLPAYWQGLFAGVVCLTVFAILLVTHAVKRAPGLTSAMIYSLPMMLAFKHGFARQDGHIQGFFSFLVAVLAVLALCARTPRGLGALTAVAALVSALALGAYWQGGFLYPRSRLRSATGLVGLRNLEATVRLGHTRARLRREGAANLAEARLPQPWLDTLSGGSVDVFPTEISYVAANSLSWVPNPALQTYGAYTEALDRRSAAHLAADGGPEFLIFEFRSIDLRHPFLDPPATVRSILQHFEYAHGEFTPGRLLLRRTEPRFHYPVGDSVEEHGQMGEWVSVPGADVLLFAELHFEMTMPGRLKRMAFRVSPVSMEVQYESGAAATFRILPDSTSNGLLLNFLPRSLEDAASLWEGIAQDRVVRFRVGGSGAFAYDLAFRIVWNATDYHVRR